MSKQHFTALAKMFRAGKPSPNMHYYFTVQWRSDVMGVAEVCRQFNQAFNDNRFVEACGFEPAQEEDKRKAVLDGGSV